MAPATLIFDLDGTLVDTLLDLSAALNGVLAEIGGAPLSAAEVRAMVGDGARVLVERALQMRGLPQEALVVALPRFVTRIGEAPAVDSAVYPGVPEILRALRAAGHRMGICTNKPVSPARALLEALGLGGFFGAVIGGDSLAARKPDPEPVRATMRLLGHRSGPTAMIGDSANDLRAGHGAGIPVVLVSYGYSAVPVATLGAERAIDRFGDLPAALDSIFCVGGSS